MRISDWSSDVCSSDLTNLHPIRARADQRPRRLSGRDIARHNLNAVRQFLDALHSDGHHFAMAVRCIDDDQVAFRIYQRFGPLQPLVAHRRRGSHAQAAGSILRGMWISYSLFNILDSDEANAMIMPIDKQQL